MAIIVKKVSDDRYLARLTLSATDTLKAEWSTAAPLTAVELVNELLKRNCHRVDIADAISEQDPRWIEKSPDRSKPTWPSDRG